MIKVLILDDAQVIRELLKLTLKSDGIHSDSAQTVEQAIHLSNLNQYDLIIVDYVLEDGHLGLEFIEAIKKHKENQNTPCIILSADNADEKKIMAQKLNVKAWLKKPFSPNSLLKVVYKILDERLPDADKEKSSMHHRD